MSERIEYCIKVKVIAMNRIGKNPLLQYESLNMDDKERLINVVIKLRKLPDHEINFEFNNISMHTVYNNEFDYASLRLQYPDIYEKHDEEYDDDLTIYRYKE
jgi:hypothetical protein